MTSEQLSTLILGTAGVFIQLIFKYFPSISSWYQNQVNKGLIALAVDFLVGALIFVFACVPLLQEQFNIPLVCDIDSGFLLLKALFVIAVSQQTTYLVTRN